MALTVKQRVSLVLETSLSAEQLLAMPDEEIDHAFLLKEQVSPTLLRAANITPLQLKAHGTNNVNKLSELGFTAMHLAAMQAKVTRFVRLADRMLERAPHSVARTALLDECNGRVMAATALRPLAVDFMDLLSGSEFEIEEFQRMKSSS